MRGRHRWFSGLIGMVIILILAASHAVASKPIRIGLSPWPGWFPWFLVKEKGFFKKHGVDVELVWFPVYSDSLQAFATGQVDANSQTLSDTLAPLARGIRVRVILVSDNSAGGDAIVARPSIQSVADLRGKRVATELGTVDHMLLLVALARNGMSEKDIQYVNMTVNDAGPAFIAGKVDAAVLWEPFRSQAVAKGQGRVLFSSADVPGLIPDLLVVHERVAREHREELVRIVAAWFDALTWWRAHPQEALTIMSKAAEMPADQYQELLKGVRLFTVEDNRRAFQQGSDYKSLLYTARHTAEFLRGAGMLPGIPRFDGVFDPTFVNQAWPLLAQGR